MLRFFNAAELLSEPERRAALVPTTCPSDSTANPLAATEWRHTRGARKINAATRIALTMKSTRLLLARSLVQFDPPISLPGVPGTGFCAHDNLDTWSRDEWLEMKQRNVLADGNI